MDKCIHKRTKDFEITGDMCLDCGKFRSSFEGEDDLWVEIVDIVKEWQDENRTYTPAERQLDVRLDCR